MDPQTSRLESTRPEDILSSCSNVIDARAAGGVGLVGRNAWIDDRTGVCRNEEFVAAYMAARPAVKLFVVEPISQSVESSGSTEPPEPVWYWTFPEYTMPDSVPLGVPGRM